MRAILLLCGLFLLLNSCSKEDDDSDVVVPVITYIVEYRVTSVSEVTVDEITYLDETGQLTTIPGQREFLLSFRADSGRKLSIEASGSIELGYVEVSIAAYAVNQPTERASDDRGFSDPGGPIPFNLKAELELP